MGLQGLKLFLGPLMLRLKLMSDGFYKRKASRNIIRNNNINLAYPLKYELNCILHWISGSLIDSIILSK